MTLIAEIAPAARFADPNLPLAIVVAATKWDEPPRMRHDVTRQLMRFFNVVFVEFIPCGEPGCATGFWQKINERLLVYTGIHRYRALPRLRANDPITHILTNHRYARDICVAIRGFAGRPRLLFNFVYEFPEIMTVNYFDWTSYFCFDEFPKMRRQARKQNRLKARYQGQIFQHYENRIARTADRCFSCHRPLYEKLSRAGGKVEFFYHANPYKSACCSKPCRADRYIHVGFAGYINYRLLDAWLRAIMAQSDMILHMIGTPEKNYMASIEGPSNLQLHTGLSDEAFRQQLMSMDVLIMPYDPEIPEVNVMTTNSKTFQYVAAGRPIVISNLPNYYEFPRGVLYKATSASDFIAQIRRALEEDSLELVQLRAKIANENTWDRRGDQIYAGIRSDLGKLLPALSKLG